VARPPANGRHHRRVMEPQNRSSTLISL
jgi:hypothetical protein